FCAVAASAASPITLIPRSASSIARRPLRITLWSSARTTLISFSRLSMNSSPVSHSLGAAKTPQREVWLSTDGTGPPPRDPCLMRILMPISEDVLARHGAPAAALAPSAAEHDLVLAHTSGRRAGQRLELELRNVLPDRDVVSLPTQVVLADGEPQAIAE